MRKTLTIVILAFALVGRAAAGQMGRTVANLTDSSDELDGQLKLRYRQATRLYEKARVSFDKRDYDKARKHLVASLVQIPELGDAHLLMAKIHYLEKEYERALLEVTQAKAGHIWSVALWERVATAKERQRQLVVTVAPSQSASEVNRAGVATGTTPQETEWEETKAGPGPMPVDYSFVHGNVLLRLGRHAEAAEQYEEVLRVRPTHGEAANNLATVYFTMREYEKALAVATRTEAHGASIKPELKQAIEEKLRHPLRRS